MSRKVVDKFLSLAFKLLANYVIRGYWGLGLTLEMAGVFGEGLFAVLAQECED